MISIKFCIVKNSEPSIFTLLFSSKYIKKVKRANATISSSPLFISSSKSSNNLSIERNQIFKLLKSHYKNITLKKRLMAQVTVVKNFSSPLSINKKPINKTNIKVF